MDKKFRLLKVIFSIGAALLIILSASQSKARVRTMDVKRLAFKPFKNAEFGSVVRSEVIRVTGEIGHPSVAVGSDGSTALRVNGGPWRMRASFKSGDTLQLQKEIIPFGYFRKKPHTYKIHLVVGGRGGKTVYWYVHERPFKKVKLQFKSGSHILGSYLGHIKNAKPNSTVYMRTLKVTAFKGPAQIYIYSADAKGKGSEYIRVNNGKWRQKRNVFLSPAIIEVRGKAPRKGKIRYFKVLIEDRRLEWLVSAVPVE